MYVCAIKSFYWRPSFPQSILSYLKKKKKSKKQSVHFNYTYGTYAWVVAIKYRLSHSYVLWGLLISIFVLES